MQQETQIDSLQNHQPNQNSQSFIQIQQHPIHGTLNYQGDFTFNSFFGIGQLKTDKYIITNAHFTSLFDCSMAVLQSENYEYIGSLRELLPHGQGQMNMKIGEDQYCYEGQFKSGKRHGVGMEIIKTKEKKIIRKPCQYENDTLIKYYSRIDEDYQQVKKSNDLNLRQLDQSKIERSSILSVKSTPQVYPIEKQYKLQTLEKLVKSGNDIKFNSSINWYQDNLLVADNTKIVKQYNCALQLVKEFEVTSDTLVVCGKKNSLFTGYNYNQCLECFKIDKQDAKQEIIQYKEDDAVFCINYQYDNLITGGRGKQLKLWNEKSVDPIQIYTGHQASILDIICLDENIVVSTSDYSQALKNGQLMIQDLRAKKDYAKIYGFSLSFDIINNSILCSLGRGLIGFYDHKFKNIDYLLSDETNQDFFAINILANNYVYGGKNKLIYLNDRQNKHKQTYQTECKGSITTIKTIDNNDFIVGDSDGYIYKYSLTEYF